MGTYYMWLLSQVSAMQMSKDQRPISYYYSYNVIVIASVVPYNVLIQVSEIL